MESFTLLLLAHLVADFMLQSRAMVRAKKRPRVFLLHIGIVAGTALVALGSLQADALAALGLVVISHALADWIKMHHRKGGGAAAFMLDQAFHLAVIAAIAAVWPDLPSRGLWGLISPDIWSRVLAAAALASGIIAAVWSGAVVVRFATRHLADRLPEPSGGLPDAGRLIGMLERGLILLFVLDGQAEGVGFLLTAKSILRFADRKRHLMEYVIVGTLASFGWALLVAVATAALIAHWMPPDVQSPCMQCASTR